MLESQFIVRISDSELAFKHPDGQTEHFAWNDLRRVEIRTTADGPMFPDIFWVLSGTDFRCVIPWGATGDTALLERLQELPEFDNNAVIHATSQTEESITLCWEQAV